MAGAQGIVSDDFSAFNWTSSTSPWTPFNVTGGAAIAQEGFGTTDARCNLTVPSGSAFGMYGSFDGFGIEQTASDGDFTIEMKIDVPATENNVEIGLWAADTARANAVTCALYRSGGAHTLWLASAIDPGQSIYYDSSPGTPVAPIWLRLGRSGNDWSGAWKDSSIETDWTTFSSGNSKTFTVNDVGIYGSNFGSASAHTCKVDYFWEITDPISPEDATSTRRVMVIS